MYRHASLVGLFGALLLVGFVHLRAAPQNAAGAKPGQDVTRVVPREQIFRNWQEADRPAGRPKSGPLKDATYQAIRTAASHTGPSNAFLVCANDFPAAVEATRRAYNPESPCAGADWTLPRLKTVAVPKEQPKVFAPDLPKPGPRPDVWLVAYLGSDSPDRWLVVRAERTGTRLRLVYTDRFRMPGLTAGDVSDPRLVWAPLGPIPGGKYTVELFETVEQEVTLSRPVRVED